MSKNKPNVLHLTDKEKDVLQFLCDELKDWRISEPDYSCVGGTDISKHFEWNKKITSGICSSLTQKGLIYTVDDFDDTIYINWDNIPEYMYMEQKQLPTKSTKNTKPYQINGAHGKNIKIAGYDRGTQVIFTIKDKKVTGEFIHFHVNKHAPNGYAVIKYKGNIYERVLSKICLKPIKTK